MNHGALASIVFFALFCSGQERKETDVNRDDLYRAAIEKLRALETSWRDRSTELPRSIEELERAVEALKSKTEESKTGSRTIPAPAGPYPPSSKPSTEEEQERRRRATEDRFPRGGPLEKETASLQSLPDETVREVCDSVRAELARFEDLSESDDRSAADASLQKLSSMLRDLAKPSR